MRVERIVRAVSAAKRCSADRRAGCETLVVEGKLEAGSWKPEVAGCCEMIRQSVGMQEGGLVVLLGLPIVASSNSTSPTGCLKPSSSALSCPPCSLQAGRTCLLTQCAAAAPSCLIDSEWEVGEWQVAGEHATIQPHPVVEAASTVIGALPTLSLCLCSISR